MVKEALAIEAETLTAGGMLAGVSGFVAVVGVLTGNRIVVLAGYTGVIFSLGGHDGSRRRAKARRMVA